MGSEMSLLFFSSDGMSDAEVESLLAGLPVQRKRWLAGFHPESRIRRLALSASGMSVGAGTHLSLGLIIIDAYTNNISIGERCSFGAYVTLISASGPDNSVLASHPDLQRAIKTEPVVIGNDCWIGAGAVVLPGIKIGDKCVIGAGAVVTKDVYTLEIVSGVPARLDRTLSVQ